MRKISLFSPDVIELLFEVIQRLQYLFLHLWALLCLIKALVDLVFNTLSHRQLILGAHTGLVLEVFAVLVDHEQTLSNMLDVLRGCSVDDDSRPTLLALDIR